MRVRKREFPLNAIRFTGNNQAEVERFIGEDGHTKLLYNRKGSIDQIQISFYYGYIRTLGIGDYLIKNRNEIYDRVNADVFKRCYEVLE
jgi:hypothetical protein